MHPVAGVGPVAVVPPSGLWGAWTFDPLVVAGLGVAAALYARGLAKLRRHRLITSGRAGYRKTARFVALLRRWALTRLTPPNPYRPSQEGSLSQ